MKRICITISADLVETGDVLDDMAAHGKIAEAMREWAKSSVADRLGIVISEPEIIDVKAKRSDAGRPRESKRTELRVGDGDAPALASKEPAVPGFNTPQGDNIEAGDAQSLAWPVMPDACDATKRPARTRTEVA